MVSEAIEILKTYTEGKDNTDKVEISVMQLNRIIKALEQQPTDAVDRVTIKEYLDSFGKDTSVSATDCISRQEVLDEIDKRFDLARPFKQLIKSMPSVTAQPCEDAISRQAVIDVISELNAISFYEAQEDSKECYYEIRNAIKQLQPVTPQPKIGRWLIKRVRDYDHAICSVCGDDSYLSPEWDALELYKYCPNCGCKMQEVEE